MDETRVWAPWRLGYIAGEKDSEEKGKAVAPEPANWLPGSEPTCFMCRAAASNMDSQETRRQNLVVAVGRHTLTLLNRYPYTNGHLLVTPLRHVGELSELTKEEQLESVQQLGRFTKLLSQLISAEGFNVGLNLGRVAGAGVPGHLHWHLVPRWQGDNNFMPTTAGTRVISQSLDSLWEAIAEEESEKNEA